MCCKQTPFWGPKDRLGVGNIDPAMPRRCLFDSDSEDKWLKSRWTNTVIKYNWIGNLKMWWKYGPEGWTAPLSRWARWGSGCIPWQRHGWLGCDWDHVFIVFVNPFFSQCYFSNAWLLNLGFELFWGRKGVFGDYDDDHQDDPDPELVRRMPPPSLALASANFAFPCLLVGFFFIEPALWPMLNSFITTQGHPLQTLTWCSFSGQTPCLSDLRLLVKLSLGPLGSSQFVSFFVGFDPPKEAKRQVCVLVTQCNDQDSVWGWDGESQNVQRQIQHGQLVYWCRFPSCCNGAHWDCCSPKELSPAT